jgi:hypothetical protein
MHERRSSMTESHADLLGQLLRPLDKAGLKAFRSLGEAEAEAVGRELARRAKQKPDKYRRIPAELVDRALEGEAAAALEIADLKLGSPASPAGDQAAS